jgi:hypothetical protein
VNDGISVGRRVVGVDLHLHPSVIAGLEVGSQLGWVRCGSTTTRRSWCARSASPAAGLPEDGACAAPFGQSGTYRATPSRLPTRLATYLWRATQQCQVIPLFHHDLA